jgi:hypothetical protein
MVRAVFALAPIFVIEDTILVRLDIFAALEIEGQKYTRAFTVGPTDQMIVVVFLEMSVSRLEWTSDRLLRW